MKLQYALIKGKCHKQTFNVLQNAITLVLVSKINLRHFFKLGKVH